jgi:hypothetical protein
MSEDKKCPKCGEPGAQLPAGKYRSEDSTVYEFDNAECRGYQCPNPGCAWVFGAPVASRPADPRRGLMSLDEVLESPSVAVSRWPPSTDEVRG